MSSKKIVVTITTGERYEAIAKITRPTLENYARKIGAEFLVWCDYGHHTHPAYQKLEIAKLLETWDRVLFVDTDILIRADAPDLFEMVPEDTFAAFNEFDFTPRVEAMVQFAKQTNAPDLNAWVQGGKYFNTGVFVCSKAHREVFEQPVPEVMNFYEQTYLNHQLHRLKVKTGDLDHRFNRMSCMDKLTGEPRYESYFMHYAGVSLETVPFVALLEADLAVWNRHPVGHRYPKNLHINVGGGIGDVCAAEPVVRYLREKLYPEDNFVVMTHHPELFDHIPGIKLTPPGVGIPDVGYYEFNLMPPKEHPITQFMVHSLCHPTDYASIMAIKGQIPNVRKHIRLSTKGHGLSSDTEEALRNSVLVHPGKGWPSKTFPREFWEAVVAKILDAGVGVTLVGHEMNSDQGYVDGDYGAAYRLFGQLSLRGLMRAVELSPVLVSNDSSPVHLAGAFEGHIGLIASCKEPFRILPFRHGFQSYKATNLSRGIIPRKIDPTHPYYLGLDSATADEMALVLPDPITVAEWAVSKFNVEKTLREDAAKGPPRLRLAPEHP